MKKLLMGSVALLLFAVSITLVQVSCSKSEAQQENAASQINNSTAQVNKIVYGQFGSGAANGIYTADYDGSNQTQVSISLPGTYFFSNNDAPALSPDGAKVFFIAIEQSTGARTIFRCDINGGNLIQAVNVPSGYQPKLGGAY